MDRKKYLWQVFIEFIIVFLLISMGLIIESFNRKILFLDNGSLNLQIIYFIFEKTSISSLVFVITFRFIKSSYYSISRTLTEKLSAGEDNGVIAVFINVFLITASLLATMLLRPIIHTTYLESDIVNFTYDFVRHDALISVITLLVIAIPLVYLLYKRDSDILKWPKIFGIIAIISIVGLVNNYKNFDARILETSASWVQKDWNEQSEVAGKALSDAKTDEEKAYAYFWLGVAENRKKNYQGAVEYQLKALSLLPDYAASHASLANAYTLLNEHQKSFEHAQKCIDYDPQYAWCYQAMANHYWVVGEEEKALKNAKTATNLDPGNRELKEMYQYILNQMNN